MPFNNATRKMLFQCDGAFSIQNIRIYTNQQNRPVDLYAFSFKDEQGIAQFSQSLTTKKINHSIDRNANIISIQALKDQPLYTFSFAEQQTAKNFSVWLEKNNIPSCVVSDTNKQFIVAISNQYEKELANVFSIKPSEIKELPTLLTAVKSFKDKQNPYFSLPDSNVIQVKSTSSTLPGEYVCAFGFANNEDAKYFTSATLKKRGILNKNLTEKNIYTLNDQYGTKAYFVNLSDAEASTLKLSNSIIASPDITTIFDRKEQTQVDKDKQKQSATTVFKFKSYAKACEFSSYLHYLAITNNGMAKPVIKNQQYGFYQVDLTTEELYLLSFLEKENQLKFQAHNRRNFDFAKSGALEARTDGEKDIVRFIFPDSVAAKRFHEYLKTQGINQIYPNPQDKVIRLAKDQYNQLMRNEKAYNGLAEHHAGLLEALAARINILENLPAAVEYASNPRFFPSAINKKRLTLLEEELKKLKEDPTKYTNNKNALKDFYNYIQNNPTQPLQSLCKSTADIEKMYPREQGLIKEWRDRERIAALILATPPTVNPNTRP
jgi:hypothetical protein